MMEEREFEQRVRACTPRLFRVCYAILPERADRDDAIQEALLKAWRRRGTLRDEAVFETWLTRIVINECKSQLRRRSRRGETELSPRLAAPVSPEPELHAALTALKWKYRVVLTLKYIDGYTIEEIARILTLPRGTVASRLDQAKRLLRAQMKGEI